MERIHQIPDASRDREELWKNRLAGESAGPTETQALEHQSGTDAFVCQPGDRSDFFTRSEGAVSRKRITSRGHCTSPGLAGPLEAIAYRFFEHGLVSGPSLGRNVLRKLDISDGQANRHWAGGICFSLFQQRLENGGIRPRYARSRGANQRAVS